ncbi:MAG TPA: calcium-binding protein [Blastocatellia bacterium]|nr:calcium-binding protein [Blastocatellia bacterium]HMX28993.1 calcium-binding protein [Blastocatellia bacterium]HMY70404.1 calcium-binding protein [Blastocatellia bacterium]HMZ17910.1 calcium-binding protein [Blastocatellia bacterium]
MSDWQGRITEIGKYEGEETVVIVWDSITLKNMPFSTIEYSEEQGLDWKVMALGINEVELTKARDTERDVEKAHAEIEKNTRWIGPDEEDKRIRKVLEGIDPDDEMALLEAWKRHLKKNVSFPFETEVYEWQDRGPLRAGDRLTVKSIVDVDDLYGILVSVRKGRERYEFPLCDLEVRIGIRPITNPSRITPSGLPIVSALTANGHT